MNMTTRYLSCILRSLSISKLAPRNCVHQSLASALLAMTVWHGIVATTQAGDGPMRVKQVSDIVANWSPNQHLYVKGSFGFGDQQLADLEKWLDENGPHWTVVLLESAAGEVHVAPDGYVDQGMDAVDYTLGKGLPNKTPFGSLEHPVTGERDGTVFVLFYRERKMSYYSSDAQDRRGLGKSNWIPAGLDRPAFRAMRGGERIMDAAKDTVSLINTRLTRQIETEQADQKRQERERIRAVAQTRLRIEEIRKEFERVEQEQAALLAAYPDANGELANPPVREWQSRLATIDDKLAPSNVRPTSQELATLSDDVSKYLNGYAASKSLDEEMAKVSATISSQGSGPNEIAAPIHRNIKASLESARAARSKGELAVGEHLATAQRESGTAKVAIATEEARVAKIAARNRAIRATAIGTTGVAGLAFSGMLFLLNRRRAPAKAKALETFAKRKTSVKEEMDNVMDLFTRSNEILGSKDKVEKRGYVGETDKLSDSTFESVDDLLIMSNEVERVMGEAEDMLEPKNPIDKVVNVFSSSKYEQAVNHISGKPLEFHRDRGLPAVFDEDVKAAAVDGEPPETITMTFEKVFSAFRQRCGDANVTLDQLENSLLTANDDLETLQKELENTASTDRLLHEAADNDGFFLTPNLFDVLLPSAQADYDAADAIAATDPVLASRKHIPAGRRKLANAKQITTAEETARRKVFPQLKESGETLKLQSYEIDWMEESVLALSQRANELYAEAAKHDITDQANAFAEEVEDLGRTAERCVACAKEIESPLVPDLGKLEKAIEAGRETISRRLKLRPDQTLWETNYVPDQRLRFAEKQIEACRAAIHRGHAEAAEKAATAAKDSLTDGHSIIDDSIAALDNFDELLRKRRGRHTTIEDRIPRLRTRLNEMHQKFADSAMIFKAGDPSFPDPHETVDNALDDAAEQSSSSELNLAESQKLFNEGRVLQAVALLDDVESMANNANQRFEDIEAHLTLLNNQLAANNREIETALGRAEGLHRELKDPRITRPTIDRYEGVAAEIETIRSGLTSGVAKRDPFAEAKPMQQLKERIDRLEAHLEGDKNAHAEATRAVRGAKTQLLTARRLIEQAGNDGIPDSQTTTQCVRELKDLDAKLTITERRLDAPHDQWQEVDADAARSQSLLSVASGRLQGELESAQRTVESFRRASQDVLQATRWAGPFGIRVSGSPGAQELERARALLNSGDYGSVSRLVRAATIAAQSAMQHAQREVARRQREQARQAEAARRRRMRSSGIQIGGGGLGGRSSSRPSRSFGGSRSTSSSRPSRPNTSGFSRSGW